MQDPHSSLDTLRQLKEMLDAGALTPTEFEALKQRLVFGELPPAVPRSEKTELPVARAADPLPAAPLPLSNPIREQESPAELLAGWSTPELAGADVPPARSSPLGLIIAVGAVLAFLAVVVYLSMSRPPSEHISSTSQTAADKLATAVETGPQAAPLPPATVAAPETLRVVLAHPAPAWPARPPTPVRDSSTAAPAPVAADSAARP